VRGEKHGNVTASSRVKKRYIVSTIRVSGPTVIQDTKQSRCKRGAQSLLHLHAAEQNRTVTKKNWCNRVSLRQGENNPLATVSHPQLHPILQRTGCPNETTHTALSRALFRARSLSLSGGRGAHSVPSFNFKFAGRTPSTAPSSIFTLGWGQG